MSTPLCGQRSTNLGNPSRHDRSEAERRFYLCPTVPCGSGGSDAEPTSRKLCLCSKMMTCA